jgi:hypothetical protein
MSLLGFIRIESVESVVKMFGAFLAVGTALRGGFGRVVMGFPLLRSSPA